MTYINLLHVSAPGCHPHAVFQIKSIQTQHANLGTDRPHWKDQNIRILKYIKLTKHNTVVVTKLCDGHSRYKFVAVYIPFKNMHL